MVRYITSSELPAYLLKRQGERPTYDFAINVKVDRRTLTAIMQGDRLPRREVCAKLGIAEFYKRGDKYFPDLDLALHINKAQGALSNKDYAPKLGISTQHLREIKIGNCRPPDAVCAKLGIEAVYRVTL